MKHKRSFSIVLSIFSLCMLSVITLSGIVYSATLSQVFKSSGPIASGTIVSLDKQASEVVASNNENINNLYGVVVENSDLSFSGTNSANTVSVANTGIVNVLVSNNSGLIKAGDSVTVDELTGIGQKATVATKVIGVAQDDLDEQAADIKEFTVGEGDARKSVKVSMLSVKIEVSDFNPNLAAANAEQSNRNKILQVADNLAGKQVKAYALVVAGLVLLIAIFISTFLVTSSGYASVISIGRNPLSEKKIIKSLLRLLSIAIGIFVGGLVLSYGILRLL